jgi:hypothetical protein
LSETRVVEFAEPLTLAGQGSFYVGGKLTHSSAPASFHAGLDGRPDYDTPGTIMAGQTYVEYEVPVDARPTPLVMLAGGCHVGTTYGQTPDGREGWRTLGVRRGFPVYLPDAARRGRSGFDPTTILEVRRGTLPPTALPNLTVLTAETNWPMNRIGPAYGTPYPGVQFPVDHYEHYMAQTVPDWDLPELRSQPLCDGFVALLEEIGPSVVFSHSASVSVGWMLVRQRPDLVKAHVAVEGGGGPLDGFSPSGPQEHDSGAAAVLEGELREYAKVPSLTVLCDYLELDPLWSRFRQSSEQFARRVSERGGLADVLDLPAVGEKGNTHVPMIDRNSAAVFDLIVDWLETRCGI